MTPLLYHRLEALGYLCHSVANTAYVIIGSLILALACRPGRRHYLSWAVPILVALTGSEIYQIHIDYHHWLYPRRGLSRTFLNIYALHLTDIAGFYGSYRLWQGVRKMSPLWFSPGRQHGPRRLKRPVSYPRSHPRRRRAEP